MHNAGNIVLQCIGMVQSIDVTLHSYGLSMKLERVFSSCNSMVTRSEPRTACVNMEILVSKERLKKNVSDGIDAVALRRGKSVFK